MNKNKLPCLMAHLFSAFIAAAPIRAQSAPEQTPPELRDFRLDPKPAEKPVEQRMGPPSDTPAPVSPVPVVAKPTPSPSPQRVQAPEPRPEREVAKKATPETPKVESKREETEESTTTDTQQSDPPAVEPVAEQEPAVTETIVPTDTKTAAPADAKLSNFSLWAGLGGLALVLALLGAWLLRRRRDTITAALAPDETLHDAYQSKPIKKGEGEALQEPLAASSARAKSAPEPEYAPRLSAEFTPENAQLSLANLTISGRLALRNISDGPLRDVKVRTTMISANEGQREMIRQFHSDDSKGHADAIGDAKAGEEIDLALEIQQPRLELNEFDWRERRFMAPIVLIHLSGRGPKGLEHCELSCLIGRETAPLAERMKPFHTDRGPRRFQGLGFRMVQI